MMEDEIVNRRNWLTKKKFVDMAGLTNLIPGPTFTEKAICWGTPTVASLACCGGVSFILPAMLIVLVLLYFIKIRQRAFSRPHARWHQTSCYRDSRPALCLGKTVLKNTDGRHNAAVLLQPYMLE